MAVTVASRRLIGAVNRESEYDILKNLMIDLEKAYDDFCNVNEEFEIIVCEEKYAEHRLVNGEDIKTYRDGVYNTYQDARKLYVYAKRENEENIRKRTAEPVKVALKSDTCRIHKLITVIDNNLELENINADVLLLDKAELQSMLNVICENVNKLYSIESQDQDLPIQKDIDEIVSDVYNRTRKINLYLHEQKSLPKSVASNMSKETSLVQVTNSDIGDATPPSTVHHNFPQVTMSPPSTVHPNIPQVTMSPPSTMHYSIPQVTMSPTSTVHPNIPQVTMTPPSTVHPNIPQVTMFPPSTVHPNISQVTMSPTSTMHHSIPQVTMSPPSTMHPNIPQVTMSPTTTVHHSIPQVTMSPPSTMHHSIPQVTMPPPSTMATTTLSLNTTSHVTIDIGDFQPQIQCTSPKVIYSLPNPPHTYGTSSLNSAANNFILCSQSPIVTSSFEHSNLFQQSQIFTSGSECNPTSIQVNPLTATPSHPPAVCLYLCNSSLQSANSPSTYPTYTRVIGQQRVVSTQSYVNSNFPNEDSTISLKRMSLPTFSGHRKDWPEFKAVWKSIAETSTYNKTALAHELKRSVKGEAKLRIKSVFITKPEAYDIMWEKLELHYEDTSASVQAALEGLRKLKPVKEEDYKGLVELVDEIESAYSQLDELKRLSTLTMRDVDFISELLLTHLKVDWRRKYRDLSPDDKLQPFKFFMTFLERERSVVARLAEQKINNQRRESDGLVIPIMLKGVINPKGVITSVLFPITTPNRCKESRPT